MSDPVTASDVACWARTTGADGVATAATGALITTGSTDTGGGAAGGGLGGGGGGGGGVQDVVPPVPEEYVWTWT
jgi:hypothetical protein